MPQEIAILFLQCFIVMFYLVFGWIFYTEVWKKDTRIYYHCVWFIVFGGVTVPLWMLGQIHKLLSKEV